MNAAIATERRGPLERVLGLFTDVRAGEGTTALLLTLNVFLILTAYYIIKPVREALILTGGGAEVKSYAAAGQAILLLVAVPAYAALAARFPRKRLITIVTLFFIACLALFYGLSGLRVPLGVVFFLWVGIFNLMVVAQFWSFANDVYTVEQGKRLFVIVAFGASAGAVFGSFVTGRLIATLGVIQMLPLAGAILFAALLLTWVVDGRSRRTAAAGRAARGAGAGAPPDGSETGDPDEPIGKGGAFQLVLSSRYLLLIAFLLLFLNWVNTTGEYILGKTVARHAAELVASGRAAGASEGQLIGKFYSDFFAVVNLAGLLVQLFLVSRVIRFLGVSRAILILPIVALGSYAILAFVPILAAVRWAKTAENSLDYSLHNTVRHALFLPTDRREKYKAKQAIDTFFVRAGDVFSAGLVYAGTTWLSFTTREFALTNLVLVGVWVVLAVLIGAEYRRRTGEGARAKGPAGAAAPAEEPAGA